MQPSVGPHKQTPKESPLPHCWDGQSMSSVSREQASPFAVSRKNTSVIPSWSMSTALEGKSASGNRLRVGASTVPRLNARNGLDSHTLWSPFHPLTYHPM